VTGEPFGRLEAQGRDDPWAARGFCRADYQRRERQRERTNDEAGPSPEAPREEFFPGV
jgi:hypothetical protein